MSHPSPLRAFLWAAASSISIGLALLVLAYLVLQPQPPRRVVLATGIPQGAYAEFGGRYKNLLARHGITVELRPTQGAAENLALLRDPRSGVDIAFVQEFPPTPFDRTLVERVRSEAIARGMSQRDIVTGAGHDAVYMARCVPTAMIFVPCKDGISHNEVEDADPKHLKAGANVLLGAMLAQAR